MTRPGRGGPPPPRSAQATARGGMRGGQDPRGLGKKQMDLAGPRLEQRPEPLATGAPRARGDLAPQSSPSLGARGWDLGAH